MSTRSALPHKLRVAHVTPAFFPADAYGGPVEALFHLTSDLAARGVNVDVTTTNANGRRTLDVPTTTAVGMSPRLSVRYFRRTIGDFSFTQICALRQAVRRADIVHLTGLYSLTTLPTLALCRWYRKPLVWSVRGALLAGPYSRRKVLKAVWRRVCRWLLATRVILHATSEAEARSALSTFGRATAVVIPNGINVPDSFVSPAVSDTLKLLFIGALRPIKGIDRLLKACAKLKRAGNVDVTLTVCGAGDRAYEGDLKGLCHSLGIDKQTTFMGHIDHTRVADTIDRHDVLVLPSHSENFGLVVLEALARARPVIASSGTPWKGLDEYRCGYWVANDPESLASAISAMAKADRAAMGARGWAWARDAFTWKSIGEQMLRAYGTLCT